MSYRKIVFYAVIISLSIAGCKKDNKGINNGDTDNNGTTPTTYIITENFESGSKGAYADAHVTLSTGQWDLNDAVIGSLAGDAKNGDCSVRLRTGSIAMLFDINGIKQISIKHAKYGSDGSSTWKLMMSADGGTTYSQIGTDITDNSTTLVTDSFKVTTTVKVRFKIEKTGSNRINIDDITFKGTGDPGVTVSDDDGDDGGSTSTPAAARGVTVGADAPPATGDNSDLLMGNPSDAQASMLMNSNYLLDLGYYTESYNSVKCEPNWVSWHLDAGNITNVSDRLNNFAAYSGLPQGFAAVQSNSYNGSITGFDRGHNCPSADRTSSADANSATFLMINMIPQAPNNNQQTWSNMENFLRRLVSAGNELYIIMGSYGMGGTGAKGGTTNAITTNGISINVPAHVWKVALVLPTGNSDITRVTTTTRVIAVDTPNSNTISSDWTKYITTVRAIEQATGYDILSALPKNVQDAIEVNKDTGI